jgi:flagellar basal body-associated protein FliL
MSGEAGGWMWLLLNVGLVALLAAALAYGMWSWRAKRRSPAIDRLRDRKTEELQRRRDPDEATPLTGGKR